MKHIIVLIGLAILMTGCGAVGDFFGHTSADSIANAPDEDEPPTLTAQAESPMTMDLGSYCWIGAEFGICADVGPPVYEEESHISFADADTLTLTFADTPPSSIIAYVHPGSNLTTRIADIPLEATLTERTITVTVPETLEGNYVLVVTAIWEGDIQGDGFYSLPIQLD